LAKAADAIGLAVLRAPAPQRRVPVEKEERQTRPRRKARRRLRLRFGRLMFAAAIAYLVGAGAIGELQLLHVQTQEHQMLQQLNAAKGHAAQLKTEVRQLRTQTGEAQAVRQVLRYAPTSGAPVIITVQP
jgi:Tfp pilus assembly protein PilN